MLGAASPYGRVFRTLNTSNTKREEQMNITRFHVIKSLAVAGIISGSASMGLQGCDTIDQYVPGGSAMLMDALGMNLNFEIKGAPSDEVDAWFFYVDRTSTMAGNFTKMSDALCKEFARTFDIQVNTATDAGMAELAEAADQIDPNTMTPLQKQWIEKNGPMIKGLVFAGVEVGGSLASFTASSPNVIEAIKENPDKYLARYGSLQACVSKVEEGVDALSRVITALAAILPAVENLSANYSRLADATGVTPPTPEEERANAGKIASKGLPAGEEVEFA